MGKLETFEKNEKTFAFSKEESYCTINSWQQLSPKMGNQDRV